MNIPFDPSTNTINFRTLPSGTLILCALSWDDRYVPNGEIIVENIFNHDDNTTSLYFCQDYFDGDKCSNMHGKKYSWSIIEYRPMNIINLQEKITIQYGSEKYFMNPELQDYTEIENLPYLYDEIIWSTRKLDDEGLKLSNIFDSYFTL